MRGRFPSAGSHASAKRGLCVATILAWFVGAAFAAEIISPMQAIYDEVRAINREIGQTDPAKIPEAYRQRLHAARQAVLDFTRYNTSTLLDRRWAWGFECAYALSAKCAWPDYPSAEHAIREAWNVLQVAQPELAGLAYDVALRITIWHVQAWTQRNPVECARLLAETEQTLLPPASAQGKQAWAFFVPNMQREIVRVSASLPPAVQAELRRLAEKSIEAIINDESVPLSLRTSHLSRWAMGLYNNGEAEQAGRLLDKWAVKYGEQIVFPEFYYARFFAALRGAGGWRVATQTIQRVNRLVYEGKASKDDPFYQLVMKGYYANLTLPEYELQRRARAAAVQTNQPVMTTTGGTKP